MVEPRRGPVRGRIRGATAPSIVVGACLAAALAVVGAAALGRSDPAPPPRPTVGVTLAAARVAPLVADLPAPRPTPAAPSPSPPPAVTVVDPVRPTALPVPVVPEPVPPGVPSPVPDPPDAAPPVQDPAVAVQATAPIDPPANAYAAEAKVVIGTIEIPTLGLAVPLNQGLSLHTIDRGPSHWPGSALPGQVGNVVVAGHRVTHTRPFRDIHTLVPGDEIVFTVDGVRSVYVVNGDEVVTPDAMRIVDPTPTPVATLFACHPPGSARYRYVVTADLVATGPLAPS